MAEVKDKVVTVESLKAKHDYDENTYLKKSGGTIAGNLSVTNAGDEILYVGGYDVVIGKDAVENNYAVNLEVNANAQFNNGLNLANAEYISVEDKNGNSRSVFGENANNDLVIGYDNYSYGDGNTNIYGNNINIHSKGNGSTNNMSIAVNEKAEIEICDKNGSSVLIPLSVEGNTVLGFDGWKDANKDTNIYGNSVKIWSNDAGLVGSEYGVNKVLWNDAYYMTETHTATLSEKVSEQAHGIVLVFSRYSNGTVQDYDYQTFFIPKYQVATHNGKGMDFLLCDSSGVMGRKYLYIYDNKIVGHTNNDATGATPSGITWTNNGFVLRHVIGV